MTKRLPFTAATIRRAVNAARSAGLAIVATSIAPDGTVTIHHEGVAGVATAAQDQRPSDFEAFEA
jgi:hypothetical protein